MNCESKFTGTLEEFYKFFNKYPKESKVEGFVIFVKNKKTLKELAIEAAKLHLPGNKIQAIKAVRELASQSNEIVECHGSNIRDLVGAKNFVESLM